MRVILVLMVVSLGGGCVQTSIFKLARHEVGGQTVLAEAPQPGIYKVKWTDRPGGDFREVKGYQRILPAGQRLGFATTQPGHVVAMAGTEEFVISNLPAEARYCVWYTRQQRPTQFTTGVGQALEAAGEVAVYAALIGLEAAIESKLGDDENDCDDGWSWNSRSKHHAHHSRDHDHPKK